MAQKNGADRTAARCPASVTGLSPLFALAAVIGVCVALHSVAISLPEGDLAQLSSCLRGLGARSLGAEIKTSEPDGFGLHC